MAQDLLGRDQEQRSPTSVDYLGAEAPLAFSAQPALPTAATGAGAGGGPSTAPPTIAGEGVAASPAEPGFGDLATAALGAERGGAGVGGGEGGSIGAEGGLGQAFGLGSLTPEGSPISIGPFGGIGLNTGNPQFDTAINTIGQAVLGVQGIPTSIPGLISFLSQSPVAAAFSTALGVIGLPLTFMNAVHLLASLSPTSTASLQRTITGLGGVGNSPDPFGGIAPEEVDATLGQLSPEELSVIAAGQQIGPVVGTPMTQGTLGFSPSNTATAAGPAQGPVPGAPGQQGTSAADVGGEGTGPGPGGPGESGDGVGGPGDVGEAP